MSRMSDLLNRIELVAVKLGMSIEEAVSILEGKHPTHQIKQVLAPVENPTVGAATSNLTPQTAGTASTASAPSAVILSTSEAGNATGSGDAAASAGSQVSSAGSIGESSNE